MVAPPATTPLGGTALQSGDSFLPRPTVQCGATSDLLPLPPAAATHAAAELLSDLSSPDLSFADVARRHNLTVEQLTLAVMSPDVRCRIAATESAACARIRLVSTLNLNTVAKTLLRVMDDFLALSQSHQASGDLAHLTDPVYTRSSDRARKAAYLLFRLARLTPIDEHALARARSLMPERTASVNERTAPPHSNSSATDPLRVSAPALPKRTASVNERTSDRVACLLEEQACDSPVPEVTHGCEDAAMPPGSPSAPSSLDQLLANLESLAAALGIDTADLDDPHNAAPLSPESLAALPPELVAYLTQNPAPDPVGSSP